MHAARLITIALMVSSALGGSTARGQTCDPLPLSGCKQPTVANKALLLIKNQGGAGDKLVWKWVKGDATAPIDFGDPINATGYTLCLYDTIGGTPTLALTASVPAGGSCDGKPCWSVIDSGFKYKDPSAANAGIKNVLLKSGAAGKAKIVVKGKDANLDTPSLPLAQDAQIVVQLKNQAGVCWEARYSPPATKNEAGQFKDKGDAPPATAVPPPTSTPNGAASTPTNTATRTPTSGSAGCGNGFLEAGETCESCAADCVISPCTPTSPTPSFAVQLSSPLGSLPTTVTVRLGYRSDLVSIPGSGNASTVRQRVTYPPPPPFPQEPNDLNYALRLVVGRNAGFANGLFATVRFDRCQGAPAPVPADFGCTVEACAGAGGAIAGCTCTVTLP
jgi:hypothetical protein